MAPRITWGRAQVKLEGGETFEGRARLEQNVLTITVKDQVVLARQVSSAKRQGGGKTWLVTTEEGEVTLRRLGCCG